MKSTSLLVLLLGSLSVFAQKIQFQNLSRDDLMYRKLTENDALGVIVILKDKEMLVLNKEDFRILARNPLDTVITNFEKARETNMWDLERKTTLLDNGQLILYDKLHDPMIGLDKGSAIFLVDILSGDLEYVNRKVSHVSDDLKFFAETQYGSEVNKSKWIEL